MTAEMILVVSLLAINHPKQFYNSLELFWTPYFNHFPYLNTSTIDSTTLTYDPAGSVTRKRNHKLLQVNTQQRDCTSILPPLHFTNNVFIHTNLYSVITFVMSFCMI
jgi:hypothetical protein